MGLRTLLKTALISSCNLEQDPEACRFQWKRLKLQSSTVTKESDYSWPGILHEIERKGFPIQATSKILRKKSDSNQARQNGSLKNSLKNLVWKNHQSLKIDQWATGPKHSGQSWRNNGPSSRFSIGEGFKVSKACFTACTACSGGLFHSDAYKRGLVQF